MQKFSATFPPVSLEECTHVVTLAI